jgi:hypothetical protein
MFAAISSSMMAMPTPFKVCAGMWFVHGFILDIGVINILPYMDKKAADAERADKFVWALGGYKDYPKVENLAPTHRRFMAENVAYAVMRIAPIFFITSAPVLMVCVKSYLIEAYTIMQEQVYYSAPPNAMLPQTLMAVFSSLVTYAVTTAPDDYLSGSSPMLVKAMQATCGLCWACFLVAAKASRGNAPLKLD